MHKIPQCAVIDLNCLNSDELQSPYNLLVPPQSNVVFDLSNLPSYIVTPMFFGCRSNCNNPNKAFKHICRWDTIFLWHKAIVNWIISCMSSSYICTTTWKSTFGLILNNKPHFMFLDVLYNMFITFIVNCFLWKISSTDLYYILTTNIPTATYSLSSQL